MLVQILNKTYDVDLIAIDKDGTLINFEQAWTGLLRDWLQRLVAHTAVADLPNQDELYRNLCHTIGYDPESHEVNPDGLAAVTTVAKIHTAAAVVFHQHGMLWPTAEQVVSETAVDDFELTTEMLHPVGRVKESITRFKQHGLKVAVATNDDRRITVETIQLLDIADQVDILACGDDPWPNKPDPAGLYQIEKETGIPTSRMLMVGDTASDMMTGKAAGVAASIGITGGGGRAAVLNEYADIVIETIDQIEILGSK